LIISFDGNTYLGKTQIILKLKDAFNAAVIEEYDTDLHVLEGKDHEQKQLYYFSLERERLHDLSRIANSLCLLDRSFLSVAAHSFAVSRIERRAYFSETLEEVGKSLLSQTVIVPDFCFFLVQNDAGFEYQDFHSKGGEDILYSQRYRYCIDEFYLRVSKFAGNRDSFYICDAAEKQDAMLAKIKELLANETGSRQNNSEILLDTLRKINDQLLAD